MKINDGVLVDQKWAERVNVKCFGLPVEGASNPVHNLFYDVRPARLESAWTENAAGVWVASACFLVNDVADTSFTFPIYAPTATSSPGGTVETTRFFVIWRGRWELLAGAGGGSPTYTAASSLGVNGVNYLYFPNTTAGNTASIITGVTASNNAITFNKITGTFAQSTGKTVVKDIT